jgi:hypothetical protein
VFTNLLLRRIILFTSPAMSPSDLRAELFNLLLGAVVLVAGVATAAFSTLRLKDRALLYLGMFAGLYGCETAGQEQDLLLCFRDSTKCI